MEDIDLSLSQAEAPGVDVVVVHQVPGTTLVVPHTGGTRLDLHRKGPLSPDTVEALRGSLIALQAGGDVPATVVEALQDQPVPVLLRSSPWLRRARALVLVDGRTTVAGVRLGYRAGLGLWVGEDTVAGSG